MDEVRVSNSDSFEADSRFMSQALDLARKAAASGEVPVGAVVVQHGEIIGSGHNRPIMDHDPSAHAEMVAIRDAARHLENYRMPDADLYVTLEPCTMCAGAIIQARIRRVIYAAHDPKAGAAGSVYNILEDGRLNHVPECSGGMMAFQSSELLKDFFAERRSHGRSAAGNRSSS